MLLDALTPADLSMPAKFTAYRRQQKEAILWLDAECLETVSALLAATGFGKTLMALSYARLSGKKTVYLVATKALQTQVYDDFRSIGLADIRGRRNYQCPNYTNCDDGYEQECSLHSTLRCPYNQAVEKAKDARFVLTNYSYWQHTRGNSRRALEREGDPVELLICDEAHELEGQITDFAEVRLLASETRRWKADIALSGLMDEPGAAGIRSECESQYARLAGSDDDDDKDLCDRLRRVIKMSGNWCWQVTENNAMVFHPVRISQFTASLFSGVARVILMSATLNEFTLRLLLPEGMKYDYRTWANVFNPGHAPVYHIPTRKMSWKSTDEDHAAIARGADEIIAGRADRKGIVHSVSYSRAQRLVRDSGHVRRFVWNKNGADLPHSLARFDASPDGTVLVTPSVAAGFDFAGRRAEYQIILKFPFPNESQRVIKERCARIPGYRLNSAAQALVQMIGRIRRYDADRGETFILDNAVRQLCGPAARVYCPPGFKIFTVAKVPPAPPRVPLAQITQ